MKHRIGKIYRGNDNTCGDSTSGARFSASVPELRQLLAKQKEFEEFIRERNSELEYRRDDFALFLENLVMEMRQKEKELIDFMELVKSIGGESYEIGESTSAS